MTRLITVLLACVAVGSPAAYAQTSRGPSGPWAKVAVCEEGGHDNPEFGYLGIYPQSWLAYGGGRFAPVAGDAAWQQQVTVANAIEGNRRGHNPWRIPDQNGCDGPW